MERNQRRPPDVNEALSSMLWTPYERTPSESSSDDDERLNAKLKKSKSTCDYSFPIKHNPTSTTTTNATTQYVPSFRKIQRYDNFRFSYPCYGPIPLVQKCITELPSYESLYQNGITPELSSITGLHGARLVHSFTDNFITQSHPSSAGAICDPSAAFLGITSSLSGFSNNFTDEDEVEEEDEEDDDNFDESLSNNNNGPISSQLPSESYEESTMSIASSQQCSSNTVSAAALLTSVANETKKWYQWRGERVDAKPSDNTEDLLLAKNNNISQRSQPHHPRKYQVHHDSLQEIQHGYQHQEPHEQHRPQNQVNLKIAKQTIPTAGGDLDVAVDKIQDLPGEINEPATHPVAVTIAPRIVSVSEQCTNNGEKPDTKCVRSVQTDLVFSSTRLVEASVDLEAASTLRQFVGLNASIDTSSVSSSSRISAIASSGESCILNDINVYDKANNNPGSISDRHPLILDVRNSLLAMRLNIPAAQPSIVDPLKGTAIGGNNNNGNGGSAITTTSVFLPLNESLITTRIARPRSTNASVNAVVSSSHEAPASGLGATASNGGAIVQSKPSLTIQVNQGSAAGAFRDSIANNSAEGFANQCAGISVVSCFSGSTVPNSCSVNNNVASVVTTTTSTATSTTENAGNSVNITTPNGYSGSENPNSAVQSNGLQAPGNQQQQQQQHIQQITRDQDENHLNHHRPLARTFTSTECQTDDLPLVDRNEISAVIAQSQTEALINREQRRRERRERRQQGRTRHPHILPPMHHQPPPPPPPMLRPSMLPDILHSHFPPPYTALQSLANPPPPPPPSSLITPVISTVPIATATAVNDGRFTIPLPVIRRSPSERSGKGCCGQWFAGPPLRALIAVVALGGVACALGGAALGATGLAGPPTSHLTAALLMIGVGVILVTVSGAAWRMTAPGGPPCLGLGSTVDLARCGRRPCNSRGAPHGLLYPEFQHRPPPPSYQASMQEYRLRLLLLDRDRQNGVVRGGSPPPTYRSHAGSLLRAPLSTPRNAFGGPGSEYSLPPSYRSRNTNVNTLTSISRSPTAENGCNSMESLNSNNVPNSSNANSIAPANSGSVSHTNSTSTALADHIQNSVSLVPQLASSIPVNFHCSNGLSQSTSTTTITTTSSSTTTTTPTTKDPVHTTIAVDASGATQPNEQQQQRHHQQHFSLNQSQILNEKLNPRVTNSNSTNNNANHGSSRTSNSSNNISGNSSSISCTNNFGSPSRVTASSFVTTMAASGSANVTTVSPKAEQSTVAGNNRKEMITIVTISASQDPSQSSSEMEILAHL